MTEFQTWSTKTPNLQLAWDATSLSSALTCWQRYKYEIVDGWRRAGKNPDTDFGSLWHGAVEEFDHSRVNGSSVEGAMYIALDWLLNAAGTEVPRKLDDLKAWVEGDALGEWVPWTTDNTKKNLRTLVRALVWYCDEQQEEDGVQPLALPTGDAAVEISFRLPLPHTSAAGEGFLLCGHMDSLARMGDEHFVRERKTTEASIGSHYMESYAPNVQVQTYDLAAWLLWPALKIKGVMVEVCQTAVGFARYMRQVFYHTDARRQEHLSTILRVLREAEQCAQNEHWPQNPAVCGLHGGCPYRKICRQDPSVREMYLSNTGEFEVRRWDPLEVR